MPEIFTSPCEPCVKCGGNRVNTQHFKGKVTSEAGLFLPGDNGKACLLDNESEHLHRTCLCGWQWCDPVLSHDRVPIPTCGNPGCTGCLTDMDIKP